MQINSKQNAAVTTITIDLKDGDQWVYLTSDMHVDSVYSARKQMLYDFDQALERNAMIKLFGDVFDAMQGRYDPRRDMTSLRPEYRRSDYFDYVIKDVAKILAPYAENLALISDGNHELSIEKNNGTNLTDRLTGQLNMQHGGKILHGGYGGWVRYMIEWGGKPKRSFKMKYFHGAGGEAPVTRGAIQTNRQAVFLPDADIIVNGHSHNSYLIPITRERISNKGVQYFDTAYHIRTPGYQQSYGDGTTGWEVTRGGVPKPLGGHYIHFYMEGDGPAFEIIPVIHNPKPISPVVDQYSGVIFPQE